MAFPFKRILCPIDFDDNAATAVALAANIARQNGGTVFLLHVVPLIAPMAMLRSLSSRFTRARKRCRGSASARSRGRTWWI